MIIHNPSTGAERGTGLSILTTPALEIAARP
jgi:hypothetical protein